MNGPLPFAQGFPELLPVTELVAGVDSQAASALAGESV